jgi:hypothetical protein
VALQYEGKRENFDTKEGKKKLREIAKLLTHITYLNGYNVVII